MICDALSTSCRPVSRLSAMMPTNIVMAVRPSNSSVVAALRLLGGLNAGTPFAIASTPVSAAQPDENVRTSRNANAKPASDCSARMCTPLATELSACSVSPRTKMRNSPHTTIPRMAAMNR